ncbi:MAG: hypothetical protein EOM18_15595 [Clostridia bacterium]|nr:hypothetical protein [Clostridia bacterium]
MTSYRKELRESFSEEDIERYQNDPRQIWKDIESNISTDPDEERASLITVPTAALKLRTASLMSKKILFAAIARSLGIAARLNPMDDSMEYWMEGEYHAVLPEQVKTSCIMIKKPEAKAEGNQEWQYAHDWTIARRTDQGYVTIQLEGTAWDEDQMQIPAESGKYRVITVNRLPNGNIFEAECTFILGENDTKTIELRAREANLGDMLENIAVYDFALKDEADQEVWMSKLSQGDRKVFVWLEESKEPTEHILNEIFDKKEAFQKHADQLNFIVRTKEARKQPTLARVLRAIDGIHIYYDDFKENINVLGRRMYVDFEKLPFVFMTAGSLNGIYAATGYNVGMADMLMKILE